MVRLSMGRGRALSHYPAEDIATINGYSKIAKISRYDIKARRNHPDFPPAVEVTTQYTYYSVTALNEFFSKYPNIPQVVSRDEASKMMQKFITTLRNVQHE